jgi:hypothetical protein
MQNILDNKMLLTGKHLNSMILLVQLHYLGVKF